jgi:hypothetical protein
LNMNNISTAERSWRNAEFVCALGDTDRHLGHLIRTEKWHAYDATHPGEASKGFKYLGAFVDVTAAKRAVESAVAETCSRTIVRERMRSAAYYGPRRAVGA